MYYREMRGNLFNISRSYLLLNCIDMQGELLSEAFKQKAPMLPKEPLKLAAVYFHEQLGAHNIATVVVNEDRQVFQQALHNVYLLCKERHITYIAMPALHLPFSNDSLKEMLLEAFHDLPVDFVIVDKKIHHRASYRKSVFTHSF